MHTLRCSMFETLTGLQRELIEQQETNALLKQKIEELESEVCTCTSILHLPPLYTPLLLFSIIRMCVSNFVIV